MDTSNFKFKCNEPLCGKGFDKLPATGTFCPFCNSANISANTDVIISPVKLPKSDNPSKFNPIEDVLVKIIVQFVKSFTMFFNMETTLLANFIMWLVMAGLLIGLFQVNSWFALFITLLFIILRRK